MGGCCREMSGDINNIETLYSAGEIGDQIEALANDIANAEFKDLLVIAILKGSFVFAADL